jgi:hypothetical protein
MRLLLFLALLLSLDACQSPGRFRSSAQPVGPVNTEAARAPTDGITPPIYRNALDGGAAKSPAQGAGLPFTRRRRRRLRRKGCGPPPTIVRPGQQTTSPRAPQECRAPPIPLQWRAVTHSRPPIAPESWGRDPLRGCALALGTAALPAARALAVNRTPRSPPSFTPRRLAAARAAFVRAEIRDVPTPSSRSLGLFISIGKNCGRC